MVELADVVVQPEQERSDERPGPVLVPAEAGHDAVGRALVLDLEHRPLARLVRGVEPLGDDPVEPGALEPVEPVGRLGPVAGRRGQVDRRLGRPEDRLEPGAPLSLLDRPEVLVPERQEVPRHEAGRRLGRQHPDPRFGRVDPEQERVEVERPVGPRDHDLAVEDAAFGERRAERLTELGEVAVERLEVPRLGEHLVAVAEDDRPEAVPLRLVQPALAVGQRAGGLRQHRLERGRDREAHPATIADRRPARRALGADPGPGTKRPSRRGSRDGRSFGAALVSERSRRSHRHAWPRARRRCPGGTGSRTPRPLRPDDHGVEPAIRGDPLDGLGRDRRPARSAGPRCPPSGAARAPRPARARARSCHPTDRSERDRGGPGTTLTTVIVAPNFLARSIALARARRAGSPPS